MEPQRAQRNTLCTQKEYPHKEITGKIISSALEVHSKLGPGLSQRDGFAIRKYLPRVITKEMKMVSYWIYKILHGVNEEALSYEFELRKIAYERQKEIYLSYKGRNIGKHRIDFLIEDEVIVELKAVDAIHRIYEAQLLTYLRAMSKRVGLLLNFNVEMLKDGIKRLII